MSNEKYKNSCNEIFLQLKTSEIFYIDERVPMPKEVDDLRYVIGFVDLLKYSSEGYFLKKRDEEIEKVEQFLQL